MISATQRLLPKEFDAESQGLCDPTLPCPGPHIDGSGQGELAVQAPTDNAWAIAFKLNVVFTLLLALYGLLSADDVWRLLEGFGLHRNHVLEFMLMAGFLIVPLAYGIPWILLRPIVHGARWMMQVSAAISLLLCFGAVYALLDAGMMLGAAELAVVCGLITLLVIRRRGSIAFAASTLKAAALCVTSTPGIMLWALCMTAIRAVWYVPTLFALGDLVASFQPEDDSYRTTDTAAEFRPLLFLWQSSVVWQFIVTGNVVAGTVASSVSSWCSSPESVEPALESFRRVLEHSLGSLCKVAMIEGIIAVVLVFVSVTLINVGAPIIPVMFAWLAVGHAVQYTVLYVGMYRLGVSEGAGRALAILRRHGLTILTNNTLMAGYLVPFATIAVIVLVVETLRHFSFKGVSFAEPEEVCIRVSIPVVFVTLEVGMNAFKAVFVYFIEDPEAFAEVHGTRDQDGVCRTWRRTQRVHPAVEEDEEEIIRPSVRDYDAFYDRVSVVGRTAS